MSTVLWEIESALQADRKANGLDKRDEVWDGVTMIMPLPNVEHQEIAAELWLIFRSVVGKQGLSLNGVNVSDRDEGWTQNFREPDVAVFLQGNPARRLDTHFMGGPDFLVEILSPHDASRSKLAFYAGIGVREVLLVDREPWSLELYQIQEGSFQLTGRATVEASEWLISRVLPIRFRLVADQARPKIEVEHGETGQRWQA